jgi:glycosyltransferase involved in cell wall biosynthesis
MPPYVTVLIPTVGRPHLLEYVFNGLRGQSFTDFGVLLVARPGDIGTMEVAERFSDFLDIKIIFQERQGLIEAYNEGIHNADGDVIVFLDDDAVPDSNCIREHVLTYERLNVSGVSGEVIPAYIVDSALKPVYGSSEVVSFYKEFNILRIIGDKLWNCPLDGQENYLAYISKAGYSRKNIRLAHKEIVSSLFCMAANMSALASAIKDFQIPSSFLKRGIDFEQVLGWKMWKNGHKMVFNHRAKVYHVLHGQSMSRLHMIENVFQAIMEDELVFYYLFLEGENLSIKHRMISSLFNALVHLKKVSENWRYELAVLKGILFGNLIGLKWIISRKFGGSYMPIQDALFK